MLAGISVVFASMFYWVIFHMIIGTKVVELIDDFDINEMWQNRLIHVTGVLVLHQIGFIEAFYFSLPFVILSVCSDIMSTLVALGYIKIDYQDHD
tara:strand:+ start:1200 stop:1484 length:285 start_codon:yes stop_codon:yes gene_type:complete